jgi:hypothetical protein
MARFEYVNDTIQELYVQTFTASVTPGAIREARVLRQAVSPVVAAGNWTATATSLAFTTLTGTVPPAGVFLCGSEKIQYGAITWTSASAGTFTSCKRGWESTTAAIHNAAAPIYFGDAFALINTNVLINATTIPFVSLDRPGSPVSQVPETGVIFVENEWIWYGGVSYTNNLKTAGNLLYCARGYNGTTAAAHDGSVTNIVIRFEHIFNHRENLALYNYASGSTYRLFYGFNPTIDINGTNALPLNFNDSVTIPLGPRNRVYVIIETGGSATGPVAVAEWR